MCIQGHDAYIIARSFFLGACASVAQTANVGLISIRKTDGTHYQVRTADFRATAVVFVSSVCPMSVQYPERLAKLASEYSQQGVQVLIVNSNVNETDHEVEKQRQDAGLDLPIYRDPSATLADKLGASAAPTAVLIDRGTVR